MRNLETTRPAKQESAYNIDSANTIINYLYRITYNKVYIYIYYTLNPKSSVIFIKYKCCGRGKPR